MTGLLIYIVNFGCAVGAVVVVSLTVVAVSVISLMIVATTSSPIPTQGVAHPCVRPLSLWCRVWLFKKSGVYGILYCQPNIV